MIEKVGWIFLCIETNCVYIINQNGLVLVDAMTGVEMVLCYCV